MKEKKKSPARGEKTPPRGYGEVGKRVKVKETHHYSSIVFGGGGGGLSSGKKEGERMVLELKAGGSTSATQGGRRVLYGRGGTGLAFSSKKALFHRGGSQPGEETSHGAQEGQSKKCSCMTKKDLQGGDLRFAGGCSSVVLYNGQRKNRVRGTPTAKSWV